MLPFATKHGLASLDCEVADPSGALDARWRPMLLRLLSALPLVPDAIANARRDPLAETLPRFVLHVSEPGVRDAAIKLARRINEGPLDPDALVVEAQSFPSVNTR